MRVALPEHVVFIGRDAFHSCRTLAEITLPKVGQPPQTMSLTPSRPARVLYVPCVYAHLSVRSAEVWAQCVGTACLPS